MVDLEHMNEKERAEYYQANKDSLDIEQTESPVLEGRRPRLSASITVRFSPEEADIIRRVAKDSNSSYSDVVRSAVRHLAAPRYEVPSVSFFMVSFTPPVPTGTIFQANRLPESSSIPRTGQLAGASS